MKDVGTTNNGDFIVEMNHLEYCELTALRAAVEGKGGLPFYIDRPNNSSFVESFDFRETFQVIRAWYIARMKVSQFQDFLNDIKKGLGDV